jgi:hypothetical protein
MCAVVEEKEDGDWPDMCVSIVRCAPLRATDRNAPVAACRSSPWRKKGAARRLVMMSLVVVVETKNRQKRHAGLPSSDGRMVPCELVGGERRRSPKRNSSSSSSSSSSSGRKQPDRGVTSLPTLVPLPAVPMVRLFWTRWHRIVQTGNRVSRSLATGRGRIEDWLQGVRRLDQGPGRTP